MDLVSNEKIFYTSTYSSLLNRYDQEVTIPSVSLFPLQDKDYVVSVHGQ